MDIINSELITIKNSGQSGIYMIINLVNNKFYIGSSIDTYHRMLSHISLLKRNKHDNVHLQNSFNKYNIGNFIWVIIEQVDNYNNLLIKEQYWLDLLDACNQDIAYNMCSIAGSPLGRKHSQETKDKISASNKGKKKSSEHIEKMTGYQSKAVIQCTSTGNFIAEWRSATFASKQLNISRTQISNCCLHKRRYCGDYLLFFKTEYYDKDFNIKDYIPKHAMSIEQYDLDNNFIARYNGYREINKFFIHEINTTNIIYCCEGKINTSYGYIWRYESAS